jgi:transposase-like protein
MGKAITCRRCGKEFTARTGTILAGKNLSYREIVLMGWMMADGKTNSEIAGVIGCNRETIRLWRHLWEQVR